MVEDFETISWHEGKLVLLDQRALPAEERYVSCHDASAVAAAIRDMLTRGAPAIGIAAAYGVVLAARAHAGADAPTQRRELARADAELRAARPTAVNLFWALDRLRALWEEGGSPPEVAARLEAEANAMAAEDAATNRAIGRHGLPLVRQGARLLHHCNTGALATAAHGTALGIVRTAHEAGRDVHVFLDETRPRLQGARLSAWELARLGVPHTLIVDGASSAVMARLGIDLVLVGADRIAANGDTANKIGTYNLAVVARHHGVPFYVAAPLATVDLGLATGAAITIEERSGEEVTRMGDTELAPPGTPVYNPAFDVTPHALITGIVTERGIAYPPFTLSLAALAGEKEHHHG